MLKHDHEFVDGEVYHLRDHVDGQLNTSVDHICANIRRNIRRHLPQVERLPAKPNTVKVMLVGGGPSAAEQADEIISRRRRGWKLVTMNGAHEWVQKELKIWPSAAVILDALPQNASFVETPHPKCKYLLASQVHPELFDRLQNNDVWIWHAGGEREKKILDQYYQRRWVGIMGGSTVATRAISILYALGFRMLAVYGMDSCLKNGKHHVYTQKWNDRAHVGKWRVGRRTFYCHDWMAVQGDEFLRIFPQYPPDLNLDFRGDGMITYIIRYTALNKRPPSIRIVDEQPVR